MRFFFFFWPGTGGTDLMQQCFAVENHLIFTAPAMRHKGGCLTQGWELLVHQAKVH